MERVVSPGARGRAGGRTDPTNRKRQGSATEQAPEGGRRRILLLVGVLVLALLAAAATWWFVLRGDAGGPQEAPAAVPGEVLTLDTVSVNLAGGKYLRVGVALQLTDDAPAKVDPAPALDLTITTLSGQDAAALADPAHREVLKQELTERMAQAYDGAVMGVYFTEFVTQ